MSTAPNSTTRAEYSNLIEMTERGCRAAHAAALAVSDTLAGGQLDPLDSIKAREEELDNLDREINEGVTAAVTQVSPVGARELLACLKVIIELERIGDLLLGVSNRLRSCASRIEPLDSRDLATMAVLLTRMLSDVGQAFTTRATDGAVSALRADSELDRVRNLVFVRHIENPEGQVRQESFHVVFMCQALERAGDHVKNVAEEVVHLVTGRSVRHLLRANDMPFENMFVEYMRKREKLPGRSE